MDTHCRLDLEWLSKKKDNIYKYICNTMQGNDNDIKNHIENESKRPPFLSFMI